MGFLKLTQQINNKMRIKMKILMIKALQPQKVLRKMNFLSLKLLQFRGNPPEK